MKVTESLKIKNFFTIEEFDWEVKEFNVLTGGMGSGKSVCVKLLWFCERVLHTLFFYSSASKDELNSDVIYDRAKEAFEDTFHTGNFDFSKTEISYLYSCNGNKFDLRAVWNDDKHCLKWSSNYIDNRLDKWLDNFGNEKTKNRFDISFIVGKQIFKSVSKDFHNTFPVGSMFFPAARAIAAITDNTDFLDPFVVRFIKNRKWLETQMKSISDEDINKILHAKNIKYDKDAGVIITLENGYKVAPRYLSSGQQELLYLILLMDYLKQNSFDAESSPISFSNRTSIFIEEPEAHLFPQNQKETLEYIIRIFRLFKDERNRNDRFFITTHSPYVLNVINNMLYKGHLIEKVNTCTDKAKQAKMLDEIKNLDFPHLESCEVSSYFIQKKVDSMINESENGAYLYEKMIEKISENIDDDYNKVKSLLNELKSE